MVQYSFHAKYPDGSGSASIKNSKQVTWLECSYAGTQRTNNDSFRAFKPPVPALSLSVIDADAAQQAHEGGCVVCGARLHRADYPRKPPGRVTNPDEGLLCSRTSFCCADRDCRKRVTPPSLRFFASRHYPSLFVVLAAILVNGASPRRVREVARSIAVDRRTLSAGAFGGQSSCHAPRYGSRSAGNSIDPSTRHYSPCHSSSASRAPARNADFGICWGCFVP
jgi:hypothetical protein